MESEEFIDYEKIRGYINITDTNLFSTYMKEVYKDLTDRAESDRKKGISKITFLDYIKLPVFIGEKLFNSLDRDGDGFLNSKEFIEGLCSLYIGDFERAVSMIFDIFDFDKDGFINRGDVKILLSYLPLKTDRTIVEYKFQLESLEEIEDIIKHTFSEGKDFLNLKEFSLVTENKKSDVFLQLLCFIYQKKPFNEENINMIKFYRRKSTQESTDNKSSSSINNSPSPKRLPSPNRKSLLSPADTFLKITLKPVSKNGEVTSIDGSQSPGSISSSSLSNSPDREKSYLNSNPNSSKSLFDKNTPQVSGIKGMIRMPNEKIANKNEKASDIESVIKNSKNVFNSPSTFLKATRKLPRKDDFNLEQNLIKMEKVTIENEEQGGNREDLDNKLKNEDNNQDNFETLNNNSESNIIYEDWIYKLSESLKIKKYWLVLIGKDIYYYKSDKKQELLGMHNLSGCFFKETGEKKINEEKMYSFCVIFTGKTRNYYCFDQKSAERWGENIKRAIGYESFFDYYEMLDDIGEGKFGLVKLGVHKKTKERVAIKIIKRSQCRTQLM